MSWALDAASYVALGLGIVNTALLIDTRAAVTRLAARYMRDTQ